MIRGGGEAPSREPRAPLSVLITALNEEEPLPGALASVVGWASEVLVVVDPRSTDRTREVAARAGARVVEHEFTGSGAQCNWGLERCANDWVFVLDADERMTSGLQAAIRAALSTPAHPAYAVRRVNFVLGKPVRFGDWGRDRVVRLLDRRDARFSEQFVHGAVLAPSTGLLSGRLEHLALRSLEEYLPKVNDYALRGARDLLGSGRRAGWPTIVGHAGWRFARAFVLRLGFLDGVRGLVVAALAAHGTFLKWAAVWEAGTTKTRARS